MNDDAKDPVAAASVQRRPLGRTGIVVSELGFGGAPLGDLYGRLDDADATAAVASAAAAGVTLFDTSPLYGFGLSEHRIGAVLAQLPRSSFVLSTKVGRVLEPAPDGIADREGYVGGLPFRSRFDYSYDGAMRSFEDSLQRLRLASVDVLLIHDIDRWTHGDDAERRFREALAGAWRALDALRSQRVVRAIGIGVNDAEVCTRMAREVDLDCVMLAGRYSLLEQPALHTFLPVASSRGIGVMIGGVFNSGILATGPVPGARYNYREAPEPVLARVSAIDAICRAHGVALADAAIRFPLAHPAVSSVVLGAVDGAEVLRNVAAVSRGIPATLWSDLVGAGLLRDDVPLPA